VDLSGPLTRQLEQLEYETRRAFEQYDEVDPRNRLVAAELERRWNEKLKERDQVKRAIAGVSVKPDLDEKTTSTILDLGDRFEKVWSDTRCPVDLRKKIARTVIEEVIAEEKVPGLLNLVIHWKGGMHTQVDVTKPKAGSGQATNLEDIDIIRRMATRYGDSDIARVLNKIGRRTGKGLRWNETRVKTVRRKHEITGQKATKVDPNILTLNGAARYAGVSDTTIKRLADAKLLPYGQLASWAPWEIKRADLDSEPVAGILHRLRTTGKLVLPGVRPDIQESLFE
jgi:hypothetical protein